MTVILDEMKKTRAQLVLEEKSRMENRETHEISNAELKRGRNHRRLHRGEKFVDMGRDVASDGKTIKARKRCEQDARLFDALGDERIEVMGLICSAFRMITEGMGVKTFNPYRTPGGDGDVNRGMRLMAVYWIWAAEVQKRGLSHADCLAIAAFGNTPHEVDSGRASFSGRQRGKRNGTAQQNLRDCLDVAIECGMLMIRRKGD